MIQRQRRLLSRSFTTQESPSASSAVERLRDTQQSIREATQEFALALETRGMEVPTIRQSIREMVAAENQLNKTNVKLAVAAEQRALDQLIRARQNLRNYLSQSSSQSSSCRQVDQQQQQKLRLEEQKKKDQQQQLSEARKNLEQLAEREREWAEKAANSQAANSQAATSELADAQRNMQQQFHELSERMKSLDSHSPVSESAAEQTRRMQDRALQQWEQGEAARSAEAARQSAEQMEQLARHLAAMNAQDLKQRMRQAHQMAEQLQARQNELHEQTKSSPTQSDAAKSDAPKSGSAESGSAAEATSTADAQTGVASQMEMLGELLDSMKSDAAGEPGAWEDQLEQALRNSPPREIARQMREAADKIVAQQRDEAERSAGRAAEQTRQLADRLGSAQAELAQPQLHELLELEEQLASWMEQAAKNQERGEPASGARQEWQSLQDRLQAVADPSDSDDPLLKELEALQRGTAHGSRSEEQPAGSDGEVRPSDRMPEGFGSRHGLPEAGALRGVARALQAKIQEAILAGARMDMDQPVPKEYQPLVDEYYRTLSDDLQSGVR